MKNDDSNKDREVPSAPELTPEQLRAVYDRLKREIDPDEMEREYRELLEHPEEWMSLEDMVKELQIEEERDRKEAG